MKLSVNDMLIKALGVALEATSRMQRHLRGRHAGQLQPRRHLGRGRHPGRPDHADHPRRGRQEPVENLDRDEGPGRARQATS